MAYSKEELFLIKASKLMSIPSLNDYINTDLDIENLMNLARNNLLLPLLYTRFIKKPRFKKIISEYESTFHSLKIAALARQLEFDYLRKETEKVSLSFIPLKGAILSRILYKEPALREMIDIDIVAKYEDAKRWHQFLKENNYVQVHNDNKVKDELLPLLSDNAIKSHVDDVKFTRGNSVLEVHFRLLSLKISDQLSNSEIWDNCITESIKDLNYKSLSPEHQLINITTHCTYHNFGFGLRSISEIDGLISYYGDRLNWKDFFSCITRLNLTKLVYIPLKLSKKFYNSHVPEDLISEIE